MLATRRGSSYSIFFLRSLIALPTFLISAKYITTAITRMKTARSFDKNTTGIANRAIKPALTMAFAVYISGVMLISAVLRSASSWSRLYSFRWILSDSHPASSRSHSSSGLVFLFCLFPRLLVAFATAKLGTRKTSHRMRARPTVAKSAVKMITHISSHLTFCIRWAS